jgi:O-acetylserine/cysteine efflux transporter
VRPLDFGAALLVMILWGGNFVVGKIGVESFPPILFMTFRFALVAILLVPFVRIPRERLGDILLLAFGLGLVHFSLFSTAVKHVDAAVGSIVIQVQVPAAALLGVLFFGDRIGWRSALGMAIALAGVAVLAGEPRAGSAPWATGVMALAALTWAGANIQMKRLSDLDGFVLNGWMALFAVPMLLLASLLLENGQWQAVRSAHWTVWAAVVFQSVVIVVFTYWQWFRLLRTYSVGQTIPFTLLVPVFGVASGIVFLGEPVTWILALGGLLTLVGVAVIVLRRPQSVEARTSVS